MLSECSSLIEGGQYINLNGKPTRSNISLNTTITLTGNVWYAININGLNASNIVHTSNQGPSYFAGHCLAEDLSSLSTWYRGETTSITIPIASGTIYLWLFQDTYAGTLKLT